MNKSKAKVEVLPKALHGEFTVSRGEVKGLGAFGTHCGVSGLGDVFWCVFNGVPGYVQSK